MSPYVTSTSSRYHILQVSSTLDFHTRQTWIHRLKYLMSLSLKIKWWRTPVMQTPGPLSIINVTPHRLKLTRKNKKKILLQWVPPCPTHLPIHDNIWFPENSTHIATAQISINLIGIQCSWPFFSVKGVALAKQLMHYIGVVFPYHRQQAILPFQDKLALSLSSCPHHPRSPASGLDNINIISIFVNSVALSPQKCNLEPPDLVWMGGGGGWNQRQRLCTFPYRTRSYHHWILTFSEMSTISLEQQQSFNAQLNVICPNSHSKYQTDTRDTLQTFWICDDVSSSGSNN